MIGLRGDFGASEGVGRSEMAQQRRPRHLCPGCCCGTRSITTKAYHTIYHVSIDIYEVLVQKLVQGIGGASGESISAP